jgi:hypothetical protein
MTIQRMHFYWISIFLLKKIRNIEIDIIYWIERQGQLYKTLPRALFFSPTIVVFSALTLLLPLSGVFAPASLTVVTRNSTHLGNCMIPTGDLSINRSISTMDYVDIIMQMFSKGGIPDLPQVCGHNCRYTVSGVTSFVFQCTPNPSSLPYGQAEDPNDAMLLTLWNGTGSDGFGEFYIAWNSNGPNHGTSGNASCSPFVAQYDVEVRYLPVCH